MKEDLLARLTSTYLERIVDTYDGLVFRRCQSMVSHAMLRVYCKQQLELEMKPAMRARPCALLIMLPVNGQSCNAARVLCTSSSWSWRSGASDAARFVRAK
jgi:hypothetical protein